MVVSDVRKPIFVGAGSIARYRRARRPPALEPRLSLRRFEQKPGELRVLGELLDRSATDREASKPVRINDVAIAPARGGWEVVSADVVEAARAALARGRRARSRGRGWAASASPRPPPAAPPRSRRRARPTSPRHCSSSTRRARRAFAALDEERAADALQEIEESDAGALLATLDRRAHGRRARRHGRRRRGRPARLRCPIARRQRAARPDGARRGRARAPPARLRAATAPAAS